MERAFRRKKAKKIKKKIVKKKTIGDLFDNMYVEKI